MIKKVSLLLLFILLIFVNNGLAGPFGLNMGMKINDFKSELKLIAGNTHKLTNVPKPNSNFESYTLLIDPKLGLAAIKAIGKNINTSVDGTGLQQQYEALREQLNNIYGAGREVKFLKAGSIWNEQKDWMMGLKLKERNLICFWGAERGNKMKDNINGITLEVVAINQHTGYLTLEYQFENAPDAIENLRRKEADSL